MEYEGCEGEGDLDTSFDAAACAEPLAQLLILTVHADYGGDHQATISTCCDS